MSNLSFDAAPVPVRDDVVAALPNVWARIGEPGAWLTGEQRTAIAAEARNVAGCALCEKRKAAISPKPYFYSESKEGGWAVHANPSSNMIRRTYFATGKSEILFESDESISQLLAFQDGREILFATHSKGRDMHRMKALRLSDLSVRHLGTTRIAPQWEISPSGR